LGIGDAADEGVAVDADLALDVHNARLHNSKA